LGERARETAGKEDEEGLLADEHDTIDGVCGRTLLLTRIIFPAQSKGRKGDAKKSQSLDCSAESKTGVPIFNPCFASSTPA
jgi:hypothetical protein